MSQVGINCPNCNGEVQVDDSWANFRCPHCSESFALEKQVADEELSSEPEGNSGSLEYVPESLRGTRKNFQNRPFRKKKPGELTRSQVILFLAVGLGTLFFLGANEFGCFRSRRSSSQLGIVKEKTREEKIQSLFSAWDGSHRGLTEIIKNSMNDPKSYEHVETRYSDQGDHLIIVTKFRGKNAFGGTVVNWVKAKVDLDGNVISVLESRP